MKLPDKNKVTRIFATEEKKISLHIGIRYIKDINQRWSLYIGVDEMTTAVELREAWSEIDSAREELKHWQGTDPTWFSVSLLSDLELQKQDSSYGDLAMDMNFDALVFLLWATDDSKGEEMKKAGIIIFHNMLQALGIKNSDIEAWLEEGKKSISKNEIPWGVTNGPIDRRRIVDALRQFKREKENQKIVLTSRQDNWYLTNIRITSITYKHWIHAIDMLKNSKLNEYKKYKERYKKRWMELYQKGVEFSGLNFQ